MGFKVMRVEAPSAVQMRRWSRGAAAHLSVSVSDELLTPSVKTAESGSNRGQPNRRLCFGCLCNQVCLLVVAKYKLAQSWAIGEDKLQSTGTGTRTRTARDSTRKYCGC